MRVRGLEHGERRALIYRPHTLHCMERNMSVEKGNNHQVPRKLPHFKRHERSNIRKFISGMEETLAHTGIGARSGPEDISRLVEEDINALWRRGFIRDRDMKWWSRAFGDRGHYRQRSSDHYSISPLRLLFSLIPGKPWVSVLRNDH